MRRFKKFWQEHKSLAFMIALSVVSLFFIYLGFAYFVELSLFGVVMATFAMIISLGALTDRYLLLNIDTLTELKNGNTAVAIALLALAVLFLACVQLL